jgi:lipid II:glycine glycyltransferase (peptidoglycan interpeptide bridge formation enzyme)
VFSSLEFARQKETGGYTARFVMVDTLAVTVLEKNAGPLGKLWYLPKGPGVSSAKELFSTLQALRPLAKKYGAFAIRTEPELSKSSQPTLARHGLVKAQPIIPNPSTITLDLTPSVDDILTMMPQKGRYAIKRAQRDDVSVKHVKATEKNCQIMFKLYVETAEGQFGIRSYDYYRTFWQRFEAAGYGQLFFAYVEGKVVAGAYAMVLGTKSTYKDGASTRKRTAYGASHLLQWEVISWAKEHGALIHDFCGAPPSGQIDNPEHPHHGIGLFKTAFSRNVIDFIGCYDYIISPTQYKIWLTVGERIFRRIHRYTRGDSYY